MNIERPTSNDEWELMKNKAYDLEERLLEYSVRIIKIVEQLPKTRTGNHVAGQLLTPTLQKREGFRAKAPRVTP